MYLLEKNLRKNTRHCVNSVSLKFIPKIMKTETVIFGGGCFWYWGGFFEIKRSKFDSFWYAGGDLENPNYYEVSAGNTQHAEVIKIVFDLKIIAFKDLLAVFFAVHNPTSTNRQGNDVGTQYRSVIMYSTENKKESEEAIKKINDSKQFDSSVVTEILPLGKFLLRKNTTKTTIKRILINHIVLTLSIPSWKSFKKSLKIFWNNQARDVL